MNRGTFDSSRRLVCGYCRMYRPVHVTVAENIAWNRQAWTCGHWRGESMALGSLGEPRQTRCSANVKCACTCRHWRGESMALGSPGEPRQTRKYCLESPGLLPVGTREENPWPRGARDSPGRHAVRLLSNLPAYAGPFDSSQEYCLESPGLGPVGTGLHVHRLQCMRGLMRILISFPLQ